MSHIETNPDPLKHGAAWRVSVKSASLLSDGTLLLVNSMNTALTIGDEDVKKIAAAIEKGRP